MPGAINLVAIGVRDLMSEKRNKYPMFVCSEVTDLPLRAWQATTARFVKCSLSLRCITASDQMQMLNPARMGLEGSIGGYEGSLLLNNRVIGIHSWQVVNILAPSYKQKQQKQKKYEHFK